MSRSDRMRNEPALKPIGLALTAVVAGLGVPGHAQAGEAAPLEPASSATRTHYLDPTTDPGFGIEEQLRIGEAAEVFAAKPEAKPEQSDLFADVPLGRKD